MEKNEPTFDVKTSRDLTLFLAGILKDLRKEEISHDTAKELSRASDKINKNNMNAIEYKRITKSKDKIEFFERDGNA